MAHRERPRVLFLVHRVPYPPDKGDRIRSYHLLRYLSRCADVFLACLADETVSEETTAALTALCVRLAVVPLGNWARWLRARARCSADDRSPKASSTRRPSWKSSVAGPGRRRFTSPWLRLPAWHPTSGWTNYGSVPAVIDLMDVDSQKWLDYAEAERGLRARLYRTEGTRLRELEQTLPSWARAVTLVSDAEADLFRQFCSWDGVHAVTNGVDLDYFRPADPPPEENGCVFVGRSTIVPTSMRPAGSARRSGR